MAGLQLTDIRKSFGDIEVIKGVSLDIQDGEFVVFVGPSGCGKSTLLRLIAGLEDISSGTLRIADRVVNELEPKERGIAMVFQSYAIFPHMSVRENMAFGLTVRRASQKQIEQRVAEAARMLKMEQLLDRRPSQLSGGQRQRVAIGRAIVRNPDVFLFDEPLSNLDAALRMNTRMEIAELHRRLGSTMIYVTHDQVEAMTLADKIVVLKDGEVQQFGKPMELFHRPANKFVAQFIGSPPMNFFDADVISATADTTEIRCESLGTVIVDNNETSQARPFATGDRVCVGLRPQHVYLDKTDKTNQSATATVHYTERLGGETVVGLTLQNGQPLLALIADDMELSQGSAATAFFDSGSLRIFDE